MFRYPERGNIWQRRTFWGHFCMADIWRDPARLRRSVGFHAALIGETVDHVGETAGIGSTRFKAILKGTETITPYEALRLAMALEITPDRLFAEPGQAPALPASAIKLYRRIANAVRNRDSDA